MGSGVLRRRWLSRCGCLSRGGGLPALYGLIDAQDSAVPHVALHIHSGAGGASRSGWASEGSGSSSSSGRGRSLSMGNRKTGSVRITSISSIQTSSVSASCRYRSRLSTCRHWSGSDRAVPGRGTLVPHLEAPTAVPNRIGNRHLGDIPGPRPMPLKLLSTCPQMG